MRDEDEPGRHGEQGRAERRGVGYDNGHREHAGGRGAELCYGRGDKTYDDERYAERDQLPQDILYGHDDVERRRRERPLRRRVQRESYDDADSYAHYKTKRQAVP